MPFALQNSQVRSAKTRVTQRVAHRIDSRVYVAQIIKEVPKLRRNPGTRRRHRLEQHQYVVWSPREDEREQDRGQCLGRLFVGLLFLRFLFLLALILGRVDYQRFWDDFRVKRDTDVGHGAWPAIQMVARHWYYGIIAVVGPAIYRDISNFFKKKLVTNEFND